jgi:hypothetical protein
MRDNVKKAFAASLKRLLRPLVRLMLREGLTYSQFATITSSVYVESAAIDFAVEGKKASIKSLSVFTGLSEHQILEVLAADAKGSGSSDLDADVNTFAKVLHGWHNDRDYVGPYGFPIDLPFIGLPISFTALVARHAPGLAPEVILGELKRIGALVEVGNNVWKPMVREYIEPSLSPENIMRTGQLVERLLATLENNTRPGRGESDRFERTVVVDEPLTLEQLNAFQKYLKETGGQFLQRVDAFAAIDLRNQTASPDEANIASINAGFQCFMYVERAFRFS